MATKIYSIELHGLQGHRVEIEADTRHGLPAFIVVGLPDPAVQEARQRVESAIKNSGYIFPRGKIIVNLAPADLRKVGPRYDLPIALGIIAHLGQIPETSLKDMAIIGELALDGSVRSIEGILSATEYAKSRGFKRLMVPKSNAREAGLIPGIKIIPVGNLKEAVQHMLGVASALPIDPYKANSTTEHYLDMALIKGQPEAKRAMQLSAAGGHNILFNGSPGAGKTMLAKALPGILPSMSMQEMLDVTKIYSVAGLLPKSKPLITQRPFRVAHHTASAVSIVGGGTTLRPGEITLAHRGVFFLDEIAEFPRSVLEVLRQPLEENTITISRASGTVTYPAQFTLVAAMNPCPCGYFNVENTKQECTCRPYVIRQYNKRISGPLLDRIDLYKTIQPVDHKKLNSMKADTSSQKIAKAVEKAVNIQRERYQGMSIRRNAELKNQMIEKHCQLSSDNRYYLEKCMEQLNLSARAYFRTIKLARTIADLEQSSSIQKQHIAEAVHYRKK